jgi:hypothetical protein
MRIGRIILCLTVLLLMSGNQESQGQSLGL